MIFIFKWYIKVGASVFLSGNLIYGAAWDYLIVS